MAFACALSKACAMTCASAVHALPRCPRTFVCSRSDNLPVARLMLNQSRGSQTALLVNMNLAV